MIKGLGDSYQPGRHGWLKFRIRDTTEAIVGAVVRSIDVPEQLVVGLFDADGELTVAGRTGPLHKAQREAVTPYPKASQAPHPWPPELPACRLGRCARDEMGGHVR